MRHFHRKQYYTRLTGRLEKFQNMDEFKKNNFKRCLKKMDLSNVIEAVDRGKIMQRNQDNGYTLYQYKKGYQYYKENPSLAAWEAIEKILKDCELAYQLLRKITDIWKRREPLYLKEKKIHRMILT